MQGLAIFTCVLLLVVSPGEAKRSVTQTHDDRSMATNKKDVSISPSNQQPLPQTDPQSFLRRLFNPDHSCDVNPKVCARQNVNGSHVWYVGDYNMVRTIDSIEWLKSKSVVLYHAMHPRFYFLAWILQGLVSKKPLEWKGGFGDANSASISLRVFPEGYELPQSKISANAPEWKKRLSSDLADAGSYTKNAADFADLVVRKSPNIEVELGDETKATQKFFDHAAGVQERLLATNINLFGNAEPVEASGSSTWQHFFHGQPMRQAGKFGISGSAVNFLEDIFNWLGSSERVREKVKKQVHLITRLFTEDPPQLLEQGVFGNSSYKLIHSLPVNPQKLCWRKKMNRDPASYFGFEGPCRSGVLLQIIFPPEKANQLVYASWEFGLPDKSVLANPRVPFFETYAQVKNKVFNEASWPKNLSRPRGPAKDLQARVLLMREPFASGDQGIQFAAHSTQFANKALMETIIVLLNEVRDTLAWDKSARD